MLKLPDKEESLLRPGVIKPTYRKLKKDAEVDTVIIGGGIAGISAAYLLKQSGQKVAVLEKDTLGSGTTGHTTGKVTSQHNLIYADLVKQHGETKARLYGEANERALAEIEKVIKKEKIDCGWERADHFVYTTDRDKIKQFKEEASVAAKLGLPASYITTTPLPFKISAAVKFTNQAHFSAQKYIDGLAKIVDGRGSHVFEQTRALGIRDGQPGFVTTPEGRVIAKNIIVATNVPTFPLLARGAYCFWEYPTTSYIVAVRPKIKLKGMYISPDKDNFSLLPVGKGKEQILLVGGKNHIPGLGRALPRQQELADYAEKHFKANKVEYRWHARDYLAYDDIPLIGPLYPWSKNLYVITAFKKWGLAHSMVAATILRDLINNQSNPWYEVYKSLRFKPVASIPKTIADTIAR